jgi:HD-like signal output (HDOD) protein
MQPADIVMRTRSLASLPNTFHEVSEAIRSPNSSAELVADAMRSDQSLCARLLKIANSSYYGYPHRVDNLRQAVVIIGTRQIQDLVAATLAVTQFRDVAPELVDMRSFWRHSLACGLAAKALAQLRREINTERAFLMGLLHDIGSLALYQQEPQLSSNALRTHRENHIPLEVAERDLLGFDHADVTTALLDMWRLPPGIKDAAGGHHRPRAAKNAVAATVVHVADSIVHALAFGTNGEAGVPELAGSAWEQIELRDSVTRVVQDEVKTRLDEVEGLFLADG